MSKPQNLEFMNPFMLLRSFRDATLDTMSKTAIEAVNTDLFAQWLGAYLNTSLTVGAPIQRAVDQYMQAVLPRLNMPSRDEVTSLARRLTNIELRLDDLDGRIDDILLAVRSAPASEPASAVAQPPAVASQDDARLQAIETRLDALLAAIQTLASAQPPSSPASTEAPAPPARRSSRKPAAPSEEPSE